MKPFILSLLAFVLLVSCGDNSGPKSTCDANCKDDRLTFKGDAKFEQLVTLDLKNCLGDSLVWTHGQTINRRNTILKDYMNEPIKLNRASISCGFQDTSFIWLAFNNCETGRGYLLKLSYNEAGGSQRLSGALNGFDPKFHIDQDLRAYTDRGNLYAVNVTNGKDTQMTFKREFTIDFDNVHKNIDTVSVTKSELFIRLIDEKGNPVDFRRKVSL